jgi:hypothetical protein
MQRTRLNTLVDLAGERLEELFINPWRRIALSLISILLGFFIGSAIVTTAGQNSQWDIIAAGLLFLFTEFTSKFVYSRRARQKSSGTKVKGSLWIDVLNLFKIGIIYSLFLEGFKLGS